MKDVLKFRLIIAMVVVVLAATVYGIWKSALKFGAFRMEQGTAVLPVEVSDTDGEGSSVSQIKDWKTYTNDAYGFEFMYPPEYSTQEVEQYGTVTVSVKNGDTTVFNFFADLDNSTGAGFDVNLYPEKIVEGPKEINIAGQILEQYKLRWEYQGETHMYRFAELKSGKKSYQFSEDPLTTTASSSDQEFFERYISTFALRGRETAGWKTYRNDKFGFELQYPPTWEFVEGSHGGAPPEPGTYGFSIFKFSSSRKILDRIDFSVASTTHQSNADLISKEPYGNFWFGGTSTREEKDFLKIGKAVILSSETVNLRDPNQCYRYVGPVYIVKVPNIFSFNDYRCVGVDPEHIMDTFSFLK